MGKTLVDLETYKTNWHRETGNRDKYTGENKQHLEGVETITRTGETDQGVTLIPVRLAPTTILRSKALKYLVLPIHPLNRGLLHKTRIRD